MKTIPFFLPLLFLAACSTPPPAYETWKANPDHEKQVATAKPATAPTAKPATAPATTETVQPRVEANGLTPEMTSKAVAITERTNRTESNGVSSQPLGRTAAEVAPATAGASAPLPTAPAPGAVNPGAAAPGAATPLGPGAPAAAAGSSSTTTPNPDDLVPAGMIRFENAPLSDVLEVYAIFVNRTLLRPQTLNAQQQITLKTQTALTRAEVKQALDAILALNGISMIDFGEKFVKVVPQAQAGTEGAANDSRDPNEMGVLGQYTTHV